MAGKKSKQESIFILGHPMHKAELYKIIAFVGCGLVLIASSVAFILRELESPAQVSASADEAVSIVDTTPIRPTPPTLIEEPEVRKIVDMSALSGIEAVLERHARVTGYSEIQHMRFYGTYSSAGVEMEIIYMAKKPHFFRQTVMYRNIEMVAGYDGEQMWQSRAHGFFDESDESLVAMNNVLFMFGVALPYLVWDFEKGVSARSTFELLDEEIWNGHRCSVIKNSGLFDDPIYHYIDKATGLELKRHMIYKAAGEAQHEVEYRYLSPLPGSEYKLPSGAEVYIDGALYGTTKHEKFEMELIMPDFLFQQR